MRVRAACGAVWLAALVGSGCASHQRPQVPAPPPDSLESYIGKVRHLSVALKPALDRRAAPIESSDPELQGALDALAAAPSAEAEDRVAAAYARLRILDAAYDHYAAAIALDERNAKAYDGMARVWRDWGAPDLGVGDARRAIYFAPASASAHNTFGTLLYALGRSADARAAFERALALDAGASYAWTNLCYLAVRAGEVTTAVSDCGRALAVDPASSMAHNNLGLAYAVAGDLSAAGDEFLKAAGPAGREFNLGIVYVASRKYPEAVQAFESALKLRPGWAAAEERTRQAQRHSLAAEEQREDDERD